MKFPQGLDLPGQAFPLYRTKGAPFHEDNGRDAQFVAPKLFRQGDELDAEIAELVVALLPKLDKGIVRKRLFRGLDLSLRAPVNGDLRVLTLRQSLAPLGPVPTGSTEIYPWGRTP